MKKPTAAAIRSAVPLTTIARGLGVDPLFVCGVCGLTVDPADLPLTVWREHDERDKPIAGTGAIVFLGAGTAHAACKKRLDDHPRLYAEEAGAPGHFPGLCESCTNRRGLACSHPDLKANGGEGLRVSLNAFAAIVCVRGGGCHKPIAHAVRCAGRSVNVKGERK